MENELPGTEPFPEDFPAELGMAGFDTRSGSESSVDRASPFEDQKNPVLIEAQRRSMVERISGWRLVGFFVSFAINVVVLCSIINLTIFAEGAKLTAVVAVIVASHCAFTVMLSGFRLSFLSKFCISWGYGVLCFWALGSLETSTYIALGGNGFHWLLLIGFQAIFLNLGAHALLCSAKQLPFFKLSYFDLLLVFTSLGVLIPLAMVVWPARADGRLTRYMLFNQSGWFAYFEAFWHSVFNGCLCFSVLHLLLGWNVWLGKRFASRPACEPRDPADDSAGKSVTNLLHSFGLPIVLIGLLLSMAWLWEGLSSSGGPMTAASMPIGSTFSFLGFSSLLTLWVLVSFFPIAGARIPTQSSEK